MTNIEWLSGGAVSYKVSGGGVARGSGEYLEEHRIYLKELVQRTGLLVVGGDGVRDFVWLYIKAAVYTIWQRYRGAGVDMFGCARMGVHTVIEVMVGQGVWVGTGGFAPSVLIICVIDFQ